MSNIEAIEWLKQIRDKYIHGGDEWFDEQRCRAIEYAIESIYKRNKWIPVTERVPKSIGLFLVIEKHWLDGSPCRRIAKWNTLDWFTADRKSSEITPRVTHWMPLPEPPKEETDG